MKIFGVSILLVTGSINAILIVFQIASGLRYIKPPFGVHKKAGIALTLISLIHAFIAIMAH